MASPTLRDPELERFYARTPGPSVAFIDEAMRENPRPGEIPFYKMTAVIFPKDRMDIIREALVDIPGSLYWHSTEEFKTASGRERIYEMATYIADVSDWNIVSIATPITDQPRSIASARAHCLDTLAREITRGSGEDAVRAIVADRNKDPHLNTNDMAVLEQLRRTRAIDIDTGFRHGRMGQEPLLWAADAAAWAVRRNIALDDGRFVEPFIQTGKLTVLDAATKQPLDMKHPQGAAAKTWGPPAPHAGEEISSVNAEPGVASRPIIGPFTPGNKVMTDLAQQARRLKIAALARRAQPQNTRDLTARKDPPTKGIDGPAL